MADNQLGGSGKQGDYDEGRVKSWQQRVNYAGTAYLRDPQGEVGRRFDARTTPHLYVIDRTGTLVYAGAIDNLRSTKVEDLAKATNYVNAALADLKAGRAVSTPRSPPYGCAVKY